MLLEADRMPSLFPQSQMDAVKLLDRIDAAYIFTSLSNLLDLLTNKSLAAQGHAIHKIPQPHPVHPTCLKSPVII